MGLGVLGRTVGPLGRRAPVGTPEVWREPSETDLDLLLPHWGERVDVGTWGRDGSRTDPRARDLVRPRLPGGGH